MADETALPKFSLPPLRERIIETGLASAIIGDPDDNAVRVILLEDALLRLATALHLSIEKEKAYPSRSKLKIRIENLRSASSLIQREIAENNTYGFIVDGANPDYLMQLRHCLELLDKRTDATIKAIRPGAGRDKHRLIMEGFSGREWCALFMVIAWKTIHLEMPRHNDPALQEACDLLWRISHIKKARKGTRESWRDHLASAKANLDGPLAGQARRIFDPEGEFAENGPYSNLFRIAKEGDC